MIFKRELAEKIVAGEKTATRRVMSSNPRSPWYSGGCRYKVGQVFAVQPRRGLPRIADARVTKVWAQELDFVGESDARKEGFANLGAFLHAFGEINPKVGLTCWVWAIEFELVAASPQNQEQGEKR